MTMFLLASNSPRRQRMLAWTGWSFDVRGADIDETPLPGENPQPYVCRLAEQKAREALSYAGDRRFVLTADTVVVDSGAILGKPSSPQEAAGMLRRLRGRVHQVYTALAVVDTQQERLEKDLCISQVPMRHYSEEELEAYVASGDPLDKAGAYAIQNPEFHPVEHFKGCFASVAGLPLCHLERTLRNFGVQPPNDVPGNCQANLKYDCPVHQAIRNGEDVG